jgi:putative endonuclease
LYTGVTGLLMSRVLCHKRGEGGCFTRKYQVNRLVWFQSFELVSAAIARFLPTPKAGSSPLKRIRNDSD